MANKEGIDTAKTLIQRVSRAFYGPKQSIVLDQLIRREAFRDDELATRVGMKTNDVAKIIVTLIEDQIISVHRRQELREGAPKAQQRTYYFMDYSHATDVIKWRMWKIQNTIDVKLRNELESQGYVCPQCRKSFSTLDANMLVDPYRGGLYCDVCDTEVRDNENEEEVRGSKDRMKRLVEQTGTIRDLLKKMDDFVLPRFDVAKWLELNGPAGTIATADTGAVTPQGAVRIQLAGDDDEAIMKAQREADAAKKRSENQLPSWIAQSTISGDKAQAQLEAEAKVTLAAQDTKPDVKPETLVLTGDPNDDEPEPELDYSAYYATLAAQEDESLVVKGSESPAVGSMFGGDDTASPATPVVFVKEEVVSEDEMEMISAEVQNGFTAEVETPGGSLNGSGKRSRDELEDGGWEDSVGDSGKKARLEEIDGGEANGEVQNGASEAVPAVEVAVGELDEEEDDDDFDFEAVDGGDGDPNPLIKVGDRMVPFLEVGDVEQAEMTPEEYTAYWDVYQRLG
ncbi:transcription initiation factor TFIIE subunit alpha [Pseudohyphozyma bogoriensis]|nr:transcription initiation factor TFIIE subunit alpha [Pseudohyphozyma bogoriensis]